MYPEQNDEAGEQRARGQSVGIFWGCRETDLDLTRGADFAWKLMWGAGPGDLGGSRGTDLLKIQRKPARKSPARPPSGSQALKTVCGAVFLAQRAQREPRLSRQKEGLGPRLGRKSTEKEHFHVV